ncbi:MAG: hypothetical protein QM496_21165 [Verrucomicrobiota bacterium]
MAKQEQQMFSDSWHRIAQERVRLSPSVEVTRQVFRGQRWFLLRDPLNNEFYRVSPAAYALIGRLRGDRTLEEVWRECLALYPEDAPGQEEVIQVLSQLYKANLLSSSFAPDSQQLFERYRKGWRKKFRGQALNFLFMQIPIFDPNRFLDAIRPVTRLLFTPLGVLLWLLVVAWGGKTAISNFDALVDQSAGVLAPSNLIYMYLCMVFLKLIHETGHAVACKQFGGEVHKFGVMLMIFTPLPFVDATWSWSFRKKWQRLLVDGAGMGVEFFIASLAALLWANSGDPFVNKLAYNVMFIASVSTLIFNINPLLRFDGYYLFSDYFEIPNLYQRAQNQIRFLAEKYLLGVRAAFSPADSASEAWWLTTYGVAAFCYRIVLLAVITFYVAQSFLGVGLAIAGFCVFMYFILPAGKFVRYLFTSDRLLRVRRRALVVVAFFLLIAIALLGYLPAPRSLRASGVISAEERTGVFVNTSGYIAEVHQHSTKTIAKGDLLVVLENPELAMEIDSMKSRLDQLRQQVELARQQKYTSILRPLQREFKAAVTYLEELERQRTELKVSAPHAGIWVAPSSREMVGTWVPRGTEVGQVIDPGSYQFIAVVNQRGAADLFTKEIQRSSVRLRGQAGQEIEVISQDILQADLEKLSTAALAWSAGGELEVDKKDDSGTAVKEGFYQVTAELNADQIADMTLYENASGQIRFELQPEPFFIQWWRLFRQVIQKDLNQT